MKILEGDKEEEPKVEEAEQKLLADEEKDAKEDAEKAKNLAFLSKSSTSAEQADANVPDPKAEKHDNGENNA